ncbi:MAG: diaminopimelate epimerase [Acidobacteriota bacterium]
MTIRFDKYQGAGNDFVIVDGRDNVLDPGDADLVRRLCDRRFGVGADGLILILPSDRADYEMRYFNADGRPGSMCGNGGRCAASFALRRKIAGPRQRFLAYDGLHEADVAGDTVRLRLSDVRGCRAVEGHYFLDTGSPHLVIFASGIDGIDVAAEGRKWRWSPLFAPGGTNVNFVETTPEGLYIRTFERGVEEETWACGTGVTASAIASALRAHAAGGPVDVRARGGRLRVEFEIRGDLVTNVRLAGPATFVFTGSIEA